MNTSFRDWFLHLARVGLCAFAVSAQAQEPAPPPAPPMAVEAPDAPPAAADVERADDAAQSREERRERRSGREWRNRHRADDRVVIGGNATLLAGDTANAVVSIMGSSTSDGDVHEAVVSVLGDTRVTGTAGDVVAVLGSVYLNGKAHGDVVAVMGSIELGPQAEVDGEVVVIGGALQRAPGAVIHGSVQNVISVPFGSFEWLRPWAQQCLIYMRPLAIGPGLGWAWGLALGFLALYVLIALLFRDTVDRCVRTFEAQPGKSIVAALLTILLTPVVFGLLFITIIGIAFVPLAALGLFLTSLFGKAVILAWIGRCCLRLTGEGGASLHTAFAVLAGGVVLLALYLVPFLGFIVYKALSILGLGVAVYALIVAMRQKRGDAGPPLAAAGAPAGGIGGMTFDAASEPRAASASPGPYGGYSGRSTSGVSETGTSSGASAAGDAGAADGVGDVGRASASASASAGAEAPGSAAAGAAAPPPGTTGASGYGGPTGPSLGSAQGPTPRPDMGPRVDPLNTAASLSYPRAGFGVRMAALFIDVILVAVLLGVLDSTREAELIALATYGAVMWKLKSTTIGGIVFGLQVVRVDGRPIDWATATVRALSCFLSLVVAGLGFIWIAFDEGKQAWHDKIAGTAVVRVPKGVSLL